MSARNDGATCKPARATLAQEGTRPGLQQICLSPKPVYDGQTIPCINGWIASHAAAQYLLPVTLLLVHPE